MWYGYRNDFLTACQYQNVNRLKMFNQIILHQCIMIPYKFSPKPKTLLTDNIILYSML